MPTYTVKAAGLKKEIPDGKYGPAKVLWLRLQEYGQPEIVLDWYTKATTPLPESGSRLEGTVEQTEYGSKFKKALGAGGGRKPPEERHSIAMQNSHGVAVR